MSEAKPPEQERSVLERSRSLDFSPSECGDVAPEPFLFTVGHSNHDLAVFLSLLNRYQIEVLIDVRSQPVSTYSPHFNGRALKEAVESAGLRYGFYGRELGGRPEGRHFYDEDGHVLYGEVARSPLFQEGIARLQRGMQRFRVAIVCSEEDPMICHRRLLVGRVLNRHGAVTHHIRGDGSVQSEIWADWEAAEHLDTFNLFANEETEHERERRTWKSIQSVLQKRARNTSSGD